MKQFKWHSKKKGFFFLLGLYILHSGCTFPKALTAGEDAGQTFSVINTKAARLNTELGLAYLKQGDTLRAKRKLLKAAAFSPKDASVHLALAYYFETVKEEKLAQSYYQKALVLAPKEGAVLNNYASFLCRQGAYAEAEALFLKALEDKHYLYIARIYENLGLCLAPLPGQAEKAAIFFSKALAEDSSRDAARLGLALLKQTHSLTL